MGKQITVYGEGKQTRSFCYVSDLVDGLIRLMNGDYIGPVNLGVYNTEPHNMLQGSPATSNSHYVQETLTR